MPASSFATAGRPDDLRISITTENELHYWTKALATTEGQLHQAIAHVGPMMLEVRKYLAANV